MLDELSELTSGELRQLRGMARRGTWREQSHRVSAAHLVAGSTSPGSVVLSLLRSVGTAVAQSSNGWCTSPMLEAE